MASGGAPSWARSVVFVLLFSVAVIVGRESRPEGSEVALVWPAAGVGAWWLMRLRGARLVVDAALLTVLTVVLQLLTGLPLVGALLFGLANLGHGLSAHWAARRLWPGEAHLTSPADVLRLVRVSAVAGLVSGSVSALLTWQLLDGDLAESFLLFVSRNAGTTFVVMATVLAVRPPHRLRNLVTRHRAGEFVGLLALTTAFSVVAVTWHGALPVGFLVITLPVWAGSRLGVPRAAAISALVSVVAVESTSAGSNALSDVSSISQLTALVQVFTVLAVLIALMLSTLQRERDEVAVQLRDSEARLRRTSESALVGTALVELDDPALVLVDANPAMRGLFPGAPEPLSWRHLLAPDSRPVVAEVLQELGTGSRRTWNGEVLHRLPSATSLWAQVHASVLAGPDGRPATAVVQMLDITARKDAEAHLSHLALHDPLTALPNRLLLRDRLDHDLSVAVRGHGRVAVVFLDLDGFKGINDALGHEVGDVVLVTAAERLQAALRPGDTVARIGGDEFVACCTDVQDADQARELATRLIDAFTPPMLVLGHLLAVGMSAGVALSQPGDSAASLLRDADAAMYAAKRAGRGRVVTAWTDPPTVVAVPVIVPRTSSVQEVPAGAAPVPAASPQAASPQAASPQAAAPQAPAVRPGLPLER
ncbi:diguanylate cyclase domain-containing protein [Aquipuribacter sp. MA13-6]|uniref:diguanylate cyclase domain-containing protein n=1 Tax=unclassified Aquipuribacter TaxID=2635084 RepID=UPI003EE96D61